MKIMHIMYFWYIYRQMVIYEKLAWKLVLHLKVLVIKIENVVNFQL